MLGRKIEMWNRQDEEDYTMHTKVLFKRTTILRDQIVAARDLVRRVPAIGNTDEAEESDVDDQEDSQYGFVLRIVFLLILAWMTLLLFNSALIVVPVSLGRILFNAISRLPFAHGINCNDLSVFSVGCYIMWTVAVRARNSIVWNKYTS